MTLKLQAFSTRALINYPEIILADEPTGNLDEANEEIVVDLFHKLHDEGTTLIVVTHCRGIYRDVRTDPCRKIGKA